MADEFDKLMKCIADEADAKVDYAAMREAVLQKAAAERHKRMQIVRYGAMAATLVILAGAGTLFLRAKGGLIRGAGNAAPQALECAPEDIGGSDMAPEPACAPEEPLFSYESESALTTEKAGSEGAAAVRGPVPNANEPAPTVGSFSGNAGPAETTAAQSAEELASLCLAARTRAEESAPQAALASFEFLYAPAEAAEGYRLMDVLADASGVTYTYNRAAAETYDDEYAVFVSAASLSGARAEADAEGIYAPAESDITVDAAGALTWALGGGKAALTPCAGCTLAEEELLALCALRLVEIG